MWTFQPRIVPEYLAKMLLHCVIHLNGQKSEKQRDLEAGWLISEIIVITCVLSMLFSWI